MLSNKRKWSLSLIMVLIMALFLPSCTAKTETMKAAVQPGAGQNFVAHLIGFEEVPSMTTVAKAQAIFHLSIDGASLGYKLIAANVLNITQAHIHLAAKGQNGPVVAWLYPSTPPAITISGRFDGILGESTILASNLVGPLAGQPLNALIDRINAGETYVNIHTEQAPGGEIRGQIYLQDSNNVVTILTSDVIGLVTAITGNNVSVQTEGRVVTVVMDNNTKIETGDVGASGQLAVGSAVHVYFDPATYITSIIELEKLEDLVVPVATTNVVGTVVSFSGIYIVVNTANGGQELVEMPGGAVLQWEDGSPASRTDLKPGVIIEATVRIGSRWATKIEIKR